MVLLSGMFYSQKHCTLKKGAMTFYTFTQLYGLYQYFNLAVYFYDYVPVNPKDNKSTPDSIHK